MRKSILILSILALALAGSAFAQNPATTSVQIQATKAESLTVSAAGLTTPFDLAAPAAQSITITSNWNLNPTKNNVDICVYMNGSMTGSDASNTDTIPASNIQANAGSGWNALNNVAGCSAPVNVTKVKNYPLTSHATRVLTAPNTDTVQINLAGVPSTIQADTYTGTITVAAYAY